MSKAGKKGLSIDEKVSRIEEWFISHPSPYTLKDLIAVLPRVTGVIPQSIEECLEILVSENRVQQKKIGIHVLFWRFPMTAAQQLAATIGGSGGASEAEKYFNMSVAQIQEEIEALKKKEMEVCRRIQEVRAEVGTEESVRQDTDKILQLQGEKKTLQSQLDKLTVFDPPMIQRVKEATVVALEAANRWTDNVYLLEFHISKRMGLSSRELRAQLQLSPDIDYIEDEDLSLPEGTVERGAARLANASLVTALSLCVKGEMECVSMKAAAHEVDTPAAVQTTTTVEEGPGDSTHTTTEAGGAKVRQYRGKQQRDNVHNTPDSTSNMEEEEEQEVKHEKESTEANNCTHRPNKRRKRNI